MHDAWIAGPWELVGPLELAMVGEALADSGSASAVALADALRPIQPAEADAILARYLWSQGKYAECYAAVASALRRYRDDPWPLSPMMRRLLAVAADLPSRDAALAPGVYELLTPPFAVSLLEEDRLLMRLVVARFLGAARVAEALHALEPDFPWRQDLLEERARVYAEVGDPRAELARQDLEAFLRLEPTAFAKGLVPAQP